MEEKRTDLLALLLRPELPNVQKELPTAEYRVKRLSEALGTDVVFMPLRKSNLVLFLLAKGGTIS